MEPKAINITVTEGNPIDRTGLSLILIISLMVMVLIVYALDLINFQWMINLDFPSNSSTWISMGIVALFILLVVCFVVSVKRQISDWLKSRKESQLQLKIEQEEYIEQLENLIEKHSKIIKRQKEQLGAALREVHSANDQSRFHERMSSIKNLIAGLSHQMNNPVNVIGGVVTPIKYNLNELEDHVSDEKGNELINEIKVLLEDLSLASGKVSEIIKNFAMITPIDVRRESGFFKPSVVFMEYIQEIQTKHPNINFKIKVPDYVELYANEGELRKVLKALINNAIEAVADEQDPVVVLRVTQDARFTHFEVGDNGEGICEEYRNKLFDPFFSTKNANKTGGLGLYLSYNIIQNHHGKIQLVDYENGLTTFRASLPRSTQSAPSVNLTVPERISTWSRN